MYRYKNDKYFLELVAKKNEKHIKGEIADLIFKYEGDKKESDAAIEYAIKNNTFSWDTHDDKDVPSHFILTKEQFNYEKGALKRNFSKVRYERVLKLIKEHLRESKPPKFEKKREVDPPKESVGGKGPEVPFDKEEAKQRRKNIRPTMYKKEKKNLIPLIIVGAVIVGLLIILSIK